MSISSPQCRAARALLDWSQDQLAENAQVSRATIADFERNLRTPMRQNMVAIENTLQAAGVGFIDENGGGCGVRFRKVELEYSRSLRPEEDGFTFSVKYRGEPYSVHIPREVIDDIHRANFPTLEERLKAVQDRLPVFLCAAEKAIMEGAVSDRRYVVLTHEKFPDGTF